MSHVAQITIIIVYAIMGVICTFWDRYVYHHMKDQVQRELVRPKIFDFKHSYIYLNACVASLIAWGVYRFIFHLAITWLGVLALTLMLYFIESFTYSLFYSRDDFLI